MAYFRAKLVAAENIRFLQCMPILFLTFWCKILQNNSVFGFIITLDFFAHCFICLPQDLDFLCFIGFRLETYLLPPIINIIAPNILWTWNNRRNIVLELLRCFGDSGGIQTHDLQNRNLTLYSAKLRSQSECKDTSILWYYKIYCYFCKQKIRTRFSCQNKNMIENYEI